MWIRPYRARVGLSFTKSSDSLHGDVLHMHALSLRYSAQRQPLEVRHRAAHAADDTTPALYPDIAWNDFCWSYRYTSNDAPRAQDGGGARAASDPPMHTSNMTSDVAIML